MDITLNSDAMEFRVPTERSADMDTVFRFISESISNHTLKIGFNPDVVSSFELKNLGSGKVVYSAKIPLTGLYEELKSLVPALRLLKS